MNLQQLRHEHPRCETCDHWSNPFHVSDGSCTAADFPGYGEQLSVGGMSADENNHGVVTNAEFYCPQHSDFES